MQTGSKQDPSFDHPEYDDIVEGYDDFRSKSDPIWWLEVNNTSLYVPPIVRGKRVLELACGSGFYSYELARWGASHVLAVDLCEAMLTKARGLPEGKELHGQRVKFQIADCTKPAVLEGAPFDVVFSAYYLPTAIDRATLTEYYRMAHVNLAEGGSFFSVVAPPSEDHVAYFDRERWAVGETGISSVRELWKEIEGGITYRNKIISKDGGKGFTYFYGHRLNKSIYEAAARDAGFTRSPIDWLHLYPPGEPIDSIPRVRKQILCPDFGLQVVRK